MFFFLMYNGAQLYLLTYQLKAKISIFISEYSSHKKKKTLTKLVLEYSFFGF